MKPLSSMSFNELLAMRAKVEAAIASRVDYERKRLTESLERLDSIARSTIVTKPKSLGLSKRRKLVAKYRNPQNPSETWAGRGLRPRWLKEALKGGKKKLSDFVIDKNAAP